MGYTWPAGSLMEHASTAVDSALVGKTRTNSILKLYDPVGVRNPNFWLPGVDLTCIASSNRRGTLITPRHFVCAHHMGEWSTDKAGIRVITMTGWTVTDAANITTPITVMSRCRVGFTDIEILQLTADVPAGITPAMVLPADFASRGLNQLMTSMTIPALCIESQTFGTQMLMVGDLYFLAANACYQKPTDLERMAFYQAEIKGDSGNPSFLLINGKAVLLSCWQNPTVGPHLGNYISAIEAVLTSMGGGYNTLSQVDLSGF